MCSFASAALADPEEADEVADGEAVGLEAESPSLQAVMPPAPKASKAREDRTRDAERLIRGVRDTSDPSTA